MVSFLKQNRDKFWLHTCILIIVGLLSYLPLVDQLGYYREGWHFAFGVTTNGPAGVAVQFSIDRPLMGIMYGFMYNFFGTSILAWSLFAIFLRIIEAIGILWLFRLVIKKEYPALVIALLCMIYPGYLQMTNGTLYQTLLMGLAAGIYSVAINIHAISVKKVWAKIVLLIGSAILSAFSYLMFEWYIGLEAIRVLLLVVLFWPQLVCKEKKWLTNAIDLAKKVILYWSTNAISTILFLYWRLHIFVSLRSVTDFDALKLRYINDPLGMLWKLIIDIFNDTYDVIFAGWFVPLYDLYKTGSKIDVVMGLVFAVASVAVVIIFIRKYRENNADQSLPPIFLWISLFSIFVTIVPFVIAGREIRYEYSLDRYTLTPSIGACLLVTWFMFAILNDKVRETFLALLIIVSVSTHYMNSAYHRDWWNYQRQLWYQLTWRAPQLEPETVLVASLPDQYALSEDYEIWGPANMIYNPGNAGMTVYAETLNKNTIWKMLGEIKEERNMRTIYFERDFSKILAITMPSGTSCMHVLGKNTIPDPANGELSTLLASHSHPDLIIPEGESPQPWTGIFGAEPDHSWCWYYQKANLAAQNNNWDEVLKLAEEAENKDLKPGNITEWIPFYNAYAKNGDTEHTSMIEDKFRSNTDYTSQLCFWINEDPSNKERLSDFESLNSSLCN